MTAPEETEYRGIRWKRTAEGSISFFDPDGGSWVDWSPGVDAPPRPPGWDRTVGGRPPRPGWRTPWRIVPLILTVVVVIIAVVQALHPSGSNVKKEAAATAAMLGKCLAQSGTADGHPKYSSTPVPCTSPKASVEVAQVVQSNPGSPLCPSGTTGFAVPYPGVRYPHILCVKPLR